MRNIIFCLCTIVVFSVQAQTKKKPIAKKPTVKTADLNYKKIFTESNSADVVMFKAGQSMEFMAQNVKIPLSFLTPENVKPSTGCAMTGTLMYKKNGMSILEGEIYLDTANIQCCYLKLTDEKKQMYFKKISESGIQFLKPFLK